MALADKIEDDRQRVVFWSCVISKITNQEARIEAERMLEQLDEGEDEEEGATSYYVYRDSKLLFRTSALEVTDKEIKYDTGTKFTYRVIASAKGVGNSTKSRTAKMFRLMPVGIKTLTNPSAGKMTVTYDKCSGCYGYVVRYGLNKDMSDANAITVKGENALSRTFAGMKKGKTY